MGFVNDRPAGSPWWSVPTPEQVPEVALVPVLGPDGYPLATHRGVQRRDTGQIVSVVSARYGLVGHREVAQAVHRVTQGLERTDDERTGPHFPREEIRVYAGGRRMEHRVVVGRLFQLASGESFYPAIRVMNSLDGTVAIRVDGYAVRIACLNQLYAGRGGTVTELRELHLASSEDLLGQVERAIHQFLANFPAALDLYEQAMAREMLASEVEPALTGLGMPRVHAGAIGARTESEASHVALVSRWRAYQIATAYLTREVKVNPDRERSFERITARAILLGAPGPTGPG